MCKRRASFPSSRPPFASPCTRQSPCRARAPQAVSSFLLFSPSACAGLFAGRASHAQSILLVACVRRTHALDHLCVLKKKEKKEKKEDCGKPHFCVGFLTRRSFFASALGLCCPPSQKKEDVPFDSIVCSASLSFFCLCSWRIALFMALFGCLPPFSAIITTSKQTNNEYGKEKRFHCRRLKSFFFSICCLFFVPDQQKGTHGKNREKKGDTLPPKEHAHAPSCFNCVWPHERRARRGALMRPRRQAHP